MNFSFDLQNIADGQGVSIAITGMVIVFFALSVISLFIAALPRILVKVAKRWPEKESHQASASVARPAVEGLSGELVAALGMALHHRRNLW